jgi:hypothetical protein
MTEVRGMEDSAKNMHTTVASLPPPGGSEVEGALMRARKIIFDGF